VVGSSLRPKQGGSVNDLLPTAATMEPSSSDSRLSDEHSQYSRSSADEKEEPRIDEDIKVEYIPAELSSSEVPITSEMLCSEDVELWLVRVPRHHTLRGNLVGSDVEIVEGAAGDVQKDSITDRKVGTLRGSYVFRDHGNVRDAELRAAFVIQDSKNQARLEIGMSEALSLT